jgi:hypothetical protein
MKRTQNTWFKSSMTLTQPGWNIGSAHNLDGLNIWSKFHDIHSRGSKDKNRTRNTWFKSSNTTGDLDLEPARLEHVFCKLSSWAEHLTKVSWNSFYGSSSYGPNINLHKWKEKIYCSNLQTPLETLTLSWPGWNMGFACRVDGVNISLKFHEIHPRSSEDMNQTRYTWYKSSNTTGDLDLEPATLEH